MNDPIKLAIMNYIQTRLNPLTMDEPATARVVQRKASLQAVSAITPALYFVAYPERKIEEDTICITLEFSVVFQLFFTSGRDPGPTTDLFEAAVQQAIEAEDQLGGLVDWVKFESNNPFILEDGGTDGGTIMQYTVQYRRQRGAPDKRYA